MKDIQQPAIIVCDKHGVVVAQSLAAERMVGQGVGHLCWQVVRRAEGADGLPCAPGCPQRLLLRGEDYPVAASVSLGDQRYRLSCLPVDGKVVSVFAGGVIPDEPEPSERLTPRELDILRLLADGMTTGEAAGKLGIGETTVRGHVERMRAKLNVSTRAGLVARGFRLNYLY